VLRAVFPCRRCPAWQLQTDSSEITVTPGETVMQIRTIGRAFESHLLAPCRHVHAKRIDEDCLIERLEDRDCRCAFAAPVCVCGASCCFCRAPGLDLVLPQPPRPPFSLSLTAQYVQNSGSVQRFMMGELQLALLLRQRMEWSHRYHPTHVGRQLDLRI
jgi:hypothetical protein